MIQLSVVLSTLIVPAVPARFLNPMGLVHFVSFDVNSGLRAVSLAVILVLHPTAIIIVKVSVVIIMRKVITGLPNVLAAIRIMLAYVILGTVSRWPVLSLGYRFIAVLRLWRSTASWQSRLMILLLGVKHRGNVRGSVPSFD